MMLTHLIELFAIDRLIIPAQTVHQIENTDQVEAEWLLIGPSGIQFFRPNGEEVVPEWAR